MHITHQQAPPSRSLTQEQRLAWLRELLNGDSETLAYRVAGTLLLLFAQPLTRIAALPTSAIAITDNHVHIWLGKEPIPVPQPFADMLINHTGSRPNLRAAGGVGASPWLFPSVHPGRHLAPQVIRERLERLGIDLLGARNTTLQSLVGACGPGSRSTTRSPPPEATTHLSPGSRSTSPRRLSRACRHTRSARSSPRARPHRFPVPTSNRGPALAGR